MKMRSLYLILAATAVVVTCEPQQNNNDIVWFPVDDEEGLFISIYGEKRGAPHNANSRSHRRARYSGMEHPSALPLSYAPTENQHPSFFYNINERPLIPIPPIPKVPSYFQNQQFPVNQPIKLPQVQANPAENFQDIFNEVYDYNKYPPVSESSASRPGSTNQWTSQPGSTNQWTSQPGSTNQWTSQPGSTNQWTSRPGSTSKWTSQPGSTNQWTSQPGSTNQWTSQPGSTSKWTSQPGSTNQWGNTNPSSIQRPGIVWETTSRPPIQRPNTSSQQGTSRPTRPGNSEWINTSRPSNRPTSQSDKLIFPDEVSLSTSLTTTTTTTPSNLLPTDPPTMSPCERLCPVTTEFNPVCGTDGVTYTNHGRLKCANKCGKDVRLAHHGSCGRTPFVTPLLSQTPKQRFKGFWTLDN